MIVYFSGPLFLVPINRLVFPGFLEQKLSHKDIDDNVVHFITLIFHGPDNCTCYFLGFNFAKDYLTPKYIVWLIISSYFSWPAICGPSFNTRSQVAFHGPQFVVHDSTLDLKLLFMARNLWSMFQH